MDNSILQALMQALYPQQSGGTGTGQAAPSPFGQTPQPTPQQPRPAGVIAPGVGVNYTNQQPTSKLNPQLTKALTGGGGAASGAGAASGLSGLGSSC
jgi:hypothetical protein